MLRGKGGVKRAPGSGVEAAGQSMTQKEEDLPVTPLRSAGNVITHCSRVRGSPTHPRTHGKLFLKTEKTHIELRKQLSRGGHVESAYDTGYRSQQDTGAVLPQDLALSVAIYRQRSAFT